MRVALATRSTHKAREIRDLLSRVAHAIPDLQLLSLDELGIPPGPEEDHIEAFDTFRENAVAKARYFAQRAGVPTIADDSGLSVAALGGAPGVRSKRFSGRADLSGKELDEANNALLLERLRGVPPGQRAAHYVCAAALAFPSGAIFTALGVCSGEIALAPRGTGGFGYDPLFIVPELGVTFGELPPEEKNRQSHRARAFRALAAELPDLLRRVDQEPESC
ncbi:MAG TPA: non-canonical purine NTP pyrophosphatase [Longimicrobiales bacterium]